MLWASGSCQAYIASGTVGKHLKTQEACFWDKRQQTLGQTKGVWNRPEDSETIYSFASIQLYFPSLYYI